MNLAVSHILQISDCQAKGKGAKRNNNNPDVAYISGPVYTFTISNLAVDVFAFLTTGLQYTLFTTVYTIMGTFCSVKSRMDDGFQ